MSGEGGQGWWGHAGWLYRLGSQQGGDSEASPNRLWLANRVPGQGGRQSTCLLLSSPHLIAEIATSPWTEGWASSEPDMSREKGSHVQPLGPAETLLILGAVTSVARNPGRSIHQRGPF